MARLSQDRRADAIVCNQGLGLGVIRRDAGRGNGLGVIEALGDGQVQLQKLGQQVSFGGEAVSIWDGGLFTGGP